MKKGEWETFLLIARDEWKEVLRVARESLLWPEVAIVLCGLTDLWMKHLIEAAICFILAVYFHLLRGKP